MIHWLAELLGLDAPGLGLLRYISFRAAAAALSAFLLTLWWGPRVIRWLRQHGMGEDTTKSPSAEVAAAHAHKKGTPTMGGIFLIGSLLVSAALWMRFDSFNTFSLPALVLIAGFGLVGLVDDWIKLKVPGKRGLRAKTKQLWLTGIALAVALWLAGPAGLESAQGGPHLYFPFAAETSVPLWVWGGVPFLLLSIVVLTGTANAVNLTDGMDGLAIGCVVTATMAYAGITWFVGHAELSDYLLVAHVPGCGEMTVLLGALLGAALGFLWFNAAPAHVFMGDLGSLGLGGALGVAALISRTELILPVVGGVFVAEALSVILQVGSFKLTGKRVFLCAPLHHHFQRQGIPETRIVVRTWVVAGLLALTSLALFKVR